MPALRYMCFRAHTLDKVLAMNKDLGFPRTNLEQLFDLFAEKGYISDHREFDPSRMEVPTRRNRLFALTGHVAKYNRLVPQDQATSQAEMQALITNVLEFALWLEEHSGFGLNLYHMLWHPDSEKARSLNSDAVLAAERKFTAALTNSSGPAAASGGKGRGSKATKHKPVVKCDDADKSPKRGDRWRNGHNATWNKVLGYFISTKDTDPPPAAYTTCAAWKVLKARDKNIIDFHDRHKGLVAYPTIDRTLLSCVDLSCPLFRFFVVMKCHVRLDESVSVCS